MLIARGISARCRAARSGLPGLNFDSFGRKLAVREFIADRRLRPPALRGLSNPVSSVRYFELAFANEALEMHGPYKEMRALDISSPRLWPFWMAEKLAVNVTMTNPDQNDLATSRRQARLLKGRDRISMVENVDATRLPFADGIYDFTTSVSVVEHINGDGDSKMMAEIARVTRPRGLVVVTFPVKPNFEAQYRKNDPYGTQNHVEGRGVFFQRFYDPDTIRSRILGSGRLREIYRRYYVEEPPGWFDAYEQAWMDQGLEWTVNDPMFMVQHFFNAGEKHPSDRMGICCMALEVQ